MTGIIEAYKRLTFRCFLVEVLGLLKSKTPGYREAYLQNFVEIGAE